jgi:hypothetical protein
MKGSAMNENPESTSNPYTTPQADLSVQRAPHEAELAGRMERLGAAMIDGLIMAVVSLGPIIAFFGGWTAYSSASTADFWRIVTRRLMPVYALNFVPRVGALLGIVNVLFIFRRSKKCLHDDIADTVVIRI